MPSRKWSLTGNFPVRSVDAIKYTGPNKHAFGRDTVPRGHDCLATNSGDSPELRRECFPNERRRPPQSSGNRRRGNYDRFLPETRYVGLGAVQKRSGRSIRAHVASAARRPASNMSPRALVALVAIACVCQAAALPVRRTLNFNMFVLKPKEGAPERTVLTTDGVSRFGPIIEYLVQRVQGLMSVRKPPDQLGSFQPLPEVANAAENEVDAVQESRMPGIVVRPSLTKPGTYEVEIDVVVDDAQPLGLKKD
ncbi:unnamed protein product, partial [Iphiclides podalirius]